jgi:hypothetical protein
MELNAVVGIAIPVVKFTPATSAGAVANTAAPVSDIVTELPVAVALPETQ